MRELNHKERWTILTNIIGLITWNSGMQTYIGLMPSIYWFSKLCSAFSQAFNSTHSQSSLGTKALVNEQMGHESVVDVKSEKHNLTGKQLRMFTYTFKILCSLSPCVDPSFIFLLPEKCPCTFLLVLLCWQWILSVSEVLQMTEPGFKSGSVIRSDS